MRGRRPKTDTLASLEGGYREGDLNGQSPSDTPILEPPDWLCELAKNEWWRVAPEMHEKGLLTCRDVAVLAAYCQCYARLIGCELQLNNGMTLEGKRHPLIGVADALHKHLKAYAVELGFTPSSRGRIVLPPKHTPEDDDFERLKRTVV